VERLTKTLTYREQINGLEPEIHRICICKLKLELERPFNETYVASHLNPFLDLAISDYRNVLLARIRPVSQRSR